MHEMAMLQTDVFERAGMDLREVNLVNNSVQALVGVQLELLRIPEGVLIGFEPSQIGSTVGGLMDACIPQLEHLIPDVESMRELGLTKAPGLLKDREGYPDYDHSSGMRVELKLLYTDPQTTHLMKQVHTRREPSARLNEQVTIKNVQPEKDLMMVVVYRLEPLKKEPKLYAPTITDVGLFPVIECIRARDNRLVERGGRWFGNYEMPAVLSNKGKEKLANNEPLNADFYGHKESEGWDYNADTNFGKLKRIPLKELQEFLKKHNASYASTGKYPAPWRITAN